MQHATCAQYARYVQRSWQSNDATRDALDPRWNAHLRVHTRRADDDAWRNGATASHQPLTPAPAKKAQVRSHLRTLALTTQLLTSPPRRLTQASKRARLGG